MSTNVNNITRIPRLLNDYIVYDNVQNNSLVYVTSDGSYKEIIADRGLLVKDANDSITSPTFKSYTGILYYSNSQLTSSDELTANNILFVNNSSRLEQITTSVNENNNEINGGVLTTYEFNDKTVTQSDNIPKFSSQFVLNNAEVTNGNQRIENPYLIYGKGINNGGLSFINASNDDKYNFISVDNDNDVIQMSNINDVFNDLGYVNTNSFKIVAIGENGKVSIITKDTINEGNYVLCNENNNLQFKELTDAFGTVTPSELELNTEQDFDYTRDDLIAQNNNDAFVVAQHSTDTLDYPYFTGENGEYWKDLSTQPFLTISNTNTINNVINNFYPVVVNTDDKNNIYTVNNLNPAYYVLNATNSTYNYEDLFNITNPYITGRNLQISNYNSGVNLGTSRTLFNLSNVLCMSNSTIFQNKGNVDISGVLQINTAENVTVNNTIIPNITNLQSITNDHIDQISNLITTSDDHTTQIRNLITTSNTHTTQILQLSTASSVFAMQISNLITTSNKHTTQIDDLNTTSNTHTTQIRNLTSARCVITTSNTAINIQNILTNNSSDPTSIIRGHKSYTSGVMYVNNSKNIQTSTPSATNQTLISTSSGYSWSKIDTNQLADDAVTSAKINDSAVGTDQLADGAVTTVNIADSVVTGSKLNFNGSTPSGSWKNVLMNNGSLVQTIAEVTNYGVFTDTGTVKNLDATVLNSVGLKFFTPTDNDGNIDESSYFATKFILYTSSSGDIDYNCNYFSFANYSSIQNFTKNLLCSYAINKNKDVIDDSLNTSIKNTYDILYRTISNNNSYGNYIKLNTSIYINTATFTNLTNTKMYKNNNNLQFNLQQLQNNNLKLIIGVYSNLYIYNDIEKYNDIMYVNNNLFQLRSELTGGMNDILLGYIILDSADFVNNNNNYTANINKQYDFESYIQLSNVFNNINNIVNTLENYSPQNILTFRPLYYINNQNQTSSLFYYDTSDIEVNNFINSFSYDDINYYSGSYTNSVVGCKINDIEITSSGIFLDKFNGNLAFKKEYFTYQQQDNQIRYTGPIIESDVKNPIVYSNDTNFYNDSSTSIITQDDDFIYMNLFVNKPFESNLIFNIKPISTYTQIQYSKSTTTYELTNPKFIFSLFNFTLTVTDYVGEYPSIIQ